MPSIDLYSATIIASDFVDAVILGYAAYWAFSIRRSLGVRLYRNQALGLGLIATIAAVLALAFGVTVGGIAPSFFGAVVEVQAVEFLFFFYWIDATALAARRSDPLLRDEFHWSSLRFPIWTLNITAFFVGLYYHLPVQIVLTLGVGIVMLPAVARRSGDHTFRLHLRWFGLYVLGQIVSFAGIFSAIGGVPLVVPIALFIVGAWGGAYCLYRSSRSLVPLNRLSLEESASMPSL